MMNAPCLPPEPFVSLSTPSSITPALPSVPKSRVFGGGLLKSVLKDGVRRLTFLQVKMADLIENQSLVTSTPTRERISRTGSKTNLECDLHLAATPEIQVSRILNPRPVAKVEAPCQWRFAWLVHVAAAFCNEPVL
jgi:hypothetical protein